MASVFVTVPKVFTLSKPNVPSVSTQTQFGSPTNARRINAVAQKWQPTNVVPQADTVLIRLEQLPEILSVGSEVGHVEPGNKVIFWDINAYEVVLGTDKKHCLCKESELLATVE